MIIAQLILAPFDFILLTPLFIDAKHFYVKLVPSFSIITWI